MGGCCAEFCNNSSSKGYIMKIFPRNSERRAIWAKNVDRKNWTPTNNSFLCEIYFASDMWQQRLDGKKKLEKDAIPTIFGFFLKKTNVINMNTSESSMFEEIDINDDVPHNISNNQLINNKSQDVAYEIIMNTSNSSLAKYDVNSDAPDCDVADHDANGDVLDISNKLLHNKNEDIRCETSTSESLHSTDKNVRKNKQCKKTEIINKQYLQIINMRRKMKGLRNKIQTLQIIIKNDKYKRAVLSIFNEDQIQTLMKKKRCRNWSHKTIQRALQLIFVCGSNGYNKLIQQGYPFPSLRTLIRRFQI
ncbi:uncharacterized protein LOC116844467 isoform X2 [Odontomachus brunneus]|uniref:uncharacterized protein LOC116844467 isoform X2 n=1 Tax=Odontomachus brunneus TaxID=486640 RepID=UPI0013F2916E|nr:uncharacterized protein LOC116844467 isoform X2 [Odontomachus brunneus]